MGTLFTKSILVFTLFMQIISQPNAYQNLNNKNIYNQTIALQNIFTENADVNREQYSLFITQIYSHLFTKQDLHKINAAPLYFESADKGTRNITLEKYFNGNVALFNAWTIRLAERLFKHIDFWQELQRGMHEHEISDEKIDGKYPQMQKQVIGIGDVHGDLQQLVIPLIREKICTATGNLVFYNTKEHRRATSIELQQMTSETIENYILIPDLKITDGIDKTHIVQLVGDIIDRGEWTDECYFLFEDLVNRAPRGLFQFTVGNHDAKVIVDCCDLRDQYYIFARAPKMRDGFRKLIRDDKVQIMAILDGTVLATHSFIEQEFVQVLIDNLDEKSVGSAVITHMKKHTKSSQIEKSLNLLGYIGNPRKYANLQKLLEKIVASSQDSKITFTSDELQLFSDFVNDIFKKAFTTDDERSVEIIRSIFWIQNSVPGTRTGARNILWSGVFWDDEDDFKLAHMVNIPSIYGHIGLLKDGKDGLLLFFAYPKNFSRTEALKMNIDTGSSYGAYDRGYSKPQYFRVNLDGSVNTVLFKNPGRIPIFSESNLCIVKVQLEFKQDYQRPIDEPLNAKGEIGLWTQARGEHINQVIRMYYAFVTEDFEYIYSFLPNGTDKAKYIEKLQQIKREYYDKLSEEDKKSLELATIFHDRGYAESKTVYEHGRKGAEFVLKYFADRPDVETIAWIIEHHGDFADVGVNLGFDDWQRTLAKNEKLAFLVAIFDAMGKVGKNNMDLFSFYLFDEVKALTREEFLDFRFKNFLSPAVNVKGIEEEYRQLFLEELKRVYIDREYWANNLMINSWAIISDLMKLPYIDKKIMVGKIAKFMKILETEAKKHQGIITFDDNINYLQIPFDELILQRRPYLERLIEMLDNDEKIPFKFKDGTLIIDLKSFVKQETKIKTMVNTMLGLLTDTDKKVLLFFSKQQEMKKFENINILSQRNILKAA